MNGKYSEGIENDISETISMLEDMKAKRILLQLPDGLKPYSFDYFNRLSEKFTVILASSTIYGACDIGSPDIYNGVDCIVQIGHSTIPNIHYPKPVIFIDHARDLEIEDVDTSILEEKSIKSIGILFSVQYRQVAERFAETLRNKGFKVLFGKRDDRTAYDGQVLGCNFTSAHSVYEEVDAYIIVSTGVFHAIGAQISVEKEVFLLDMNEKSLKSMKNEADRFIRRRYGMMFRAGQAKKICIIVDTKIGQRREKLASRLLEMSRKAGLNAITAYADNASDSDFVNMGCDAVVFTGCPRVPIDDESRYSMPVLTPAEYMRVFFNKSGRYVMDEIVSVDDPAEK
ncbi:MAG: diphthamide biosynthesis enzyme Dph2 [Thermoplasmata archaeon]